MDYERFPYLETFEFLHECDEVISIDDDLDEANEIDERVVNNVDFGAMNDMTDEANELEWAM